MRSVTVICDACGAKVPPSEATRIRWPRDDRRAAWDACPDCAEKVRAALGKPLPLFDRPAPQPVA